MGFKLEKYLEIIKEKGKDAGFNYKAQYIPNTLDHYESAYKKHSEMGCVCFENKEMGIYFIQDPDGYWLEIIPEDKD